MADATVDRKVVDLESALKECVMGEGYSSDEMRKYNERGSQWLDSCSHSDYDSSVISFSENSSISFSTGTALFYRAPLII